MAISAPIAGAYNGAWNSSALLYTRQGYNIHFSQKGERVEETDLYGLCLIEIIGRGSSLRIDTICKVFSAATTRALWPWVGAAAFGTVYNSTSPIAQLASNIGAFLVLTAVPNTPAASSPNTFTTTRSILSPDQDHTLVFNSTLREVPLSFDVLLSDSAGVGSYFVAA